MPRNNRSNQPDVYFVNYDLRKEEKTKFKKWVAAESANLDNMLIRVAEGDYQVSMKYDEYNSCYASFMSPRGEKAKVNEGLILTGRGSTPLMALMGVLFRHFVLFEGEWSTHKSSKGSVDDVD